jgi:hypothetical protein
MCPYSTSVSCVAESSWLVGHGWFYTIQLSGLLWLAHCVSFSIWFSNPFQGLFVILTFLSVPGLCCCSIVELHIFFFYRSYQILYLFVDLYKHRPWHIFANSRDGQWLLLCLADSSSWVWCPNISSRLMKVFPVLPVVFAINGIVVPCISRSGYRDSIRLPSSAI